MRPGKTYITSTIKAKCIIEVGQNIVAKEDELSQLFEIYLSGENKKYTLIAKDVFEDPTPEEIEKTLTKAWKWYRSFLESEETKPIRNYLQS